MRRVTRYEVDEAFTLTDADGWTLEENDCDWSHPDDCDTCGHPYCDQSC